MNASERWHEYSEEEKMDKILHRALQSIQESIFKYQTIDPNMFKEYIQLNKDMLDWLAPKIGMEGLPLYYGPGKNSADISNDKI